VVSLVQRYEFLITCVGVLAVTGLVVFDLLLLSRVRKLKARLKGLKERAQIEDASRIHAKEIDSLSRLASTLSHDLNNSIGTIMGYASLLKKRFSRETKEFHYSEIIETSSKQMADLVKRVLGFSQLDAKTVEVVELNQFVQKTAEDFLKARGEGYDVKVYQPSRPATAQISTSQLRQAILAILDNAADSMASGGIIRCHVGRYEGSPSEENSQEKESGCYIEIEDSGTGMDHETKDRIFEPFFTTKTGKKYTGLSMSQVFGIVKHHNGSIFVDSSPGNGTKVKIILPFHAGQKIDLQRNASSPAAEMKGIKILIVDDEESVRRLGSDILSEHGFNVITANDGRDALEKLKQNSDVRLVILDMIMPVMTGKEACIEIKKMKKPPKVLICTGFSGLSDLKTIVGTYAEGLLPKPYSTADLVKTVENFLKAP